MAKRLVDCPIVENEGHVRLAEEPVVESAVHVPTAPRRKGGRPGERKYWSGKPIPLGQLKRDPKVRKHLKRDDLRRNVQPSASLKADIGEFAREEVQQLPNGRFVGIAKVIRRFGPQYRNLQRRQVLNYRAHADYFRSQAKRVLSRANKGKDCLATRVGQSGRRGVRMPGRISLNQSPFQDVNFLAWNWYKEEISRGVTITDTKFFMEYSTKLTALLTSAGDEVPLHIREAWLKRVDVFAASTESAFQIKKRILKALGIGEYAVQLLSDLTENELFDRIFKTWQNFDFAVYTIAAAGVGDPDALEILRRYWATPEPLLPYWRHVAIILFDHVPEAMKRLDQKVLHDQADRKKQRTSGNGGAVKGTRGGGAAEKWRFTGIMGQLILGWLDSSREPEGIVLPTACIGHGTETCLEDIPAQVGADGKLRYCGGPRKGEVVHGNTMKTWRELRSADKLRFLDEKVFVWQQDNAWCTANLARRLLRVYVEFILPRNGYHPTGYITNADLFIGTWCAETKAAAKEDNNWMTPIGGGATLPCQATDAFIVYPAKKESQALMRQRMEEHIALGEPAALSSLDLYDGVLQQHLRTERENEKSNLVLRAGLGVGLLARRPHVDGSRLTMLNVRKCMQEAPDAYKWSKGWAPCSHNKALKEEWAASRYSVDFRSAPVWSVDELKPELDDVQDPGSDALDVAFACVALDVAPRKVACRPMGPLVVSPLYGETNRSSRSKPGRLNDRMPAYPCSCKESRCEDGISRILHTESCPNTHLQRLMGNLQDRGVEGQRKAEADKAKTARDAAIKAVGKLVAPPNADYSSPGDDFVTLPWKVGGKAVLALKGDGKHGYKLEHAAQLNAEESPAGRWLADELRARGLPTGFWNKALLRHGMVVDYALIEILRQPCVDVVGKRSAAVEAQTHAKPSKKTADAAAPCGTNITVGARDAPSGKTGGSVPTPSKALGDKECWVCGSTLHKTEACVIFRDVILRSKVDGVKLSPLGTVRGGGGPRSAYWFQAHGRGRGDQTAARRGLLLPQYRS